MKGKPMNSSHSIGRRNFIQTVGAGGAATVALRVSGITGAATLVAFLSSCGETVLSWLRVVMNVAGEAGTLLGELGFPKGVEIAAKLTAIAKKIDAAVRSKDFKNAFDFLSEVIKPGGLFDELLAIAGVAKNDIINKGLVVMRFALSIIAGLIQKGLQTPQGAAMMASAGPDYAAKLAVINTWASLDAGAVLGLKP